MKAKNKTSSAKGRRTTSLAKIKSNRKNALKSTGPKTPKGKRIVKWNALKHGLLAKEIVIEVGDGKEDGAEFNRLFSRLWNELQPVGVLEEMLVEKIATCYWRLKRVIRCETGEIRKRADTASWRELFRLAEKIDYERRFLMLDESRQNLKKNSMGIVYLINVLEEVRVEAEAEGHLSEKTQEKLFEHFGREENNIAYWCSIFSYGACYGPNFVNSDPDLIDSYTDFDDNSSNLADTDFDSDNNDSNLADSDSDSVDSGSELVLSNHDEFSGTLSPEICKSLILHLLDEEIKNLRNMKEVLQKIENLEIEAKIASFSIPPKETTEKILRYEAAIERQLYRAIQELERLQEQRKRKSSSASD